MWLGAEVIGSLSLALEEILFQSVGLRSMRGTLTLIALRDNLPLKKTMLSSCCSFLPVPFETPISHPNLSLSLSLLLPSLSEFHL